MGTLGNAILGLIFWTLGLANTLLMFKLWGYPFDHERMASAAPRPLMALHRATGYAFLAIYLYLMSQMVPRLWQYQVELPARTVAHLVMGISIGILLALKILIVRFFKHLESTMVPFLGTLLLVCTTVLIGLSVPISLREAYMSRRLATGLAVSDQAIERVKTLLPKAGLPKEIPVQQIATLAGLSQGRAVLLRKCVQCHDLRTVLAKPRTPENWVETIRRMGERAVLDPISEDEQWHVAAYLVAVSPDLQKAMQRKRHQELAQVSARVVKSPVIQVKGRAVPRLPFDTAGAREAFESTCNGCHSLTNVENSPPQSEAEARDLVARMVENGLSAPPGRLEQIVSYLAKTYGK
jgi:mono/diheme cytochrome c family protein